MAKIKTTVSEMTRALDTIEVVLNDKLVSEELRNLIFYIKGDEVKVVGKNVSVCCIANIEAEVDGVQEDLIPVRAKELCSVLGTYKSLRRTKATDIVFDIKDNSIKCTISEEPASESMDFSEKYYRESVYTFPRPRSVTEMVRQEIYSATTIPNGVEIKRSDVKYYMDALLPTIKEGQGDITSWLHLVGDYIYTVPSAYIALMHNKLDGLFRDFVLKSTVANFIGRFFELSETTTFAKKEEGDVVLISLENENAQAIIRAMPKRMAFKLTNYMGIPAQGVCVDKGYLVDVLKRLVLSKENISMTIPGDGDIVLKTAKSSATIPVLFTRFEDNFEGMCVSILPDVFENIIFSHKDFGTLVYLYFEKVDNKWFMTVTDNGLYEDGSHIWMTKINCEAKRVQQ